MSDPDPQRELPNRTGGGCCGCKSRQERRGHDPLEKYGMVADRTRKCTDVACLFLFFLALLAMISVSAIALKYGNVKRLIYGTDYLGRTCGYDAGVEDKTLVVYPRFLASQDDHFESQEHFNDGAFFGVCVSDCPQFFYNFSSPSPVMTSPTQQSMVCNDHIPYRKNHQAYVETYKCFYNISNNGNIFDRGHRCTVDGRTFLRAVILSNCWDLPWRHGEAFYRCIPRTQKFDQSEMCSFPADVKDPKDSRCQLVLQSGQSLEPIQRKQQAIIDSLLSVRSLLGRFLNDALNAKEVILVCGILFAGVASCILLFFIQKFFGTIIWSVMIGSFIICALLTVILSFKSGMISNSKIEGSLGDEVDKLLQRADDEIRYILASAAVIMATVTAVVACLILYMRNSINKTVRIIQLSTNALMSMPATYLCPVINAVFITALAAFGVLVTASIYSLENQEFEQLHDDIIRTDSKLGGFLSNSTDFSSINRENSVHWMLGYHVFGIFWIASFLSGLTFMAIAGAVGAWYFSLEEGKNETNSSAPIVTEEELALDDIRPPEMSRSQNALKFRKYRANGSKGNSELLSSLHKAIRYHLGSIAFGSLCLTILRILTIVTVYAMKRFKRKSKRSIGMRALCCFCTCFLFMIQKLVSLVTRQAYALVAIKGRGFFWSARKTMSLLYKSGKLVATARGATVITMFVCKLFVTVSATVLSILWIDSRDDGNLSSAWFPALITFLAAYGTSSPFFRVLSTCVDTIIVSYLIDIEENEELNGIAAPLHLSAKSPNVLNKSRWKVLREDGDAKLVVDDDTATSRRQLLQSDPTSEA